MKGYRWLCLLLGLLLVSAVEVRADLLSDGWAAYNKGNYEEAYDLFSKAFRADPGSIDANLALGQAALKKGKYSHAIFAFDRILMLDPGHQKARSGKAEALMALGQTHDARMEYAQLLKGRLDPAERSRIKKSVAQIDRKSRQLKLKGEISVSVFYDDNINFGPADGTYVLPPNRQNATWGIEGGAAVSAEYDVGQEGSWVAVGSASVLNSWLDSDTAQEARTTKLRAGVRKVEQRNLYEIVPRLEMISYGHDPLVNIYAIDGAWLHARTRNDYLITRASLERRNYDDKIDPAHARDSIYFRAGETWKHFFENRRNTVAVGTEFFAEDARQEINSNNGFRLLVDGERELPAGVIGYVGGRYRLTNYKAAALGSSQREDNRWDFIIGAKRRLTENCMLDLRYQYIRNDSNLGVSDYNRNRISLTATVEF
jgi:hypothetical protein